MSIDSLFRLFLNDSMNPTSSNDVSICLTTEGKPFWQTIFTNYSLFTRKNYQEGILDKMNQVIGLTPEMPSYFIYQCNSVICVSDALADSRAINCYHGIESDLRYTLFQSIFIAIFIKIVTDTSQTYY